MTTPIKLVRVDELQAGDHLSRWGTSTRLYPRVSFTSINGELTGQASFSVNTTSNTKEVVMTSDNPADFEVVADLLSAAAQHMRQMKGNT